MPARSGGRFEKRGDDVVRVEHSGGHGPATIDDAATQQLPAEQVAPEDTEEGADNENP